jgi:very-short-patch-repair endonuclease
VKLIKKGLSHRQIFKFVLINLKMVDTKFKKGLVPWNKGKRGVMPVPWNKGIKTKKPAWNSEKKNPYSKETLKKMSLAAKVSINTGRFTKGHKFSEKTLKKISKSQLKRFSDPEQIKIISDAHLGNEPWNKGKTDVYSEGTLKMIRESRLKQIFPKKDSIIETKIQNFLQQLGIDFLKHKIMKEIKYSYQCDIFIPSMNLIIECDGNYWHKYPVGTERDLIRTKDLVEKGFNVLRLWESDIKKMEIKDFMEKIKPFDKFR